MNVNRGTSNTEALLWWILVDDFLGVFKTKLMYYILFVAV